MSHTSLRPVLADEILDFARRRLMDRRHFAPAPERDQLDEALRWIDGGVYGGCSVCGTALDPEQIMAAPEQMCCQECLRIARQRANGFWSARRVTRRQHGGRHHDDA